MLQKSGYIFIKDTFLNDGSLGRIWLGRYPDTPENIRPIDRLSNRLEAWKLVCFIITNISYDQSEYSD